MQVLYRVLHIVVGAMLTLLLPALVLVDMQVRKAVCNEDVSFREAVVSAWYDIKNTHFS